MTIDTSDRVQHALREGRGVVALESTLICHGIPRPRNAALAFAMEDAVRDAGAEPASIAVLDGRVKVGLSRTELEHLSSTAEAEKCSTRSHAGAGRCSDIGTAARARSAHMEALPLPCEP